MDTKQIVQASANVIRITKLVKGDIYKRFDGDSDCWLGIVENIYNDGVKAIIQATEYKKRWNDEIEVRNSNLAGDKDYTIFPASQEDFSMEFSSVINGLERKVDDCEKLIVTYRKNIKFTESLRDGTFAKSLTTPNSIEMTQGEYEEKTKMLGM